MKNREIKFRAWDTIDNKWLFGYDYKNLGGFNIVGEVTLFGELNTISLDRWNDVEIMQFTGLKDKNGVEIYEGDIVVRTGYYYGTNSKPKPIVKTGSVKWNEETASFLFYVGHYLGLFADNLEIEVIGNIYEHPHLLTPQS